MQMDCLQDHEASLKFFKGFDEVFSQIIILEIVTKRYREKHVWKFRNTLYVTHGSKKSEWKLENIF